MSPELRSVRSESMGLFDFIQQEKKLSSGKDDVHKLIDDLRSGKSREQRLRVEEHLLEMREQSVYPLINALSDDDWRVREESAKLLGRIGDERSVEYLIRLFKDEKIRVQLWATDSLISMGTVAVGPLIDALDDPDRRVRMGAIVALAEIHDIYAVDYLKKLEHDSDAEVRSAATEAILLIGELSAVPEA
jgi:HEAT repeat protein